MEPFYEKTIKRKEIFQGKIISLHVDDVELPDGNFSKREVVTHPGAVAIIAITPEGKLLLVKQFRKPLERAILEIPAGKIEAKEAPEVTALRELEEETGYSAKALHPVTSFYTSPGFANEIIYLYRAEGVYPLEEKVKGDEDEFLEVVELPLDEAQAYLDEQKIHDAKTAFAILYLTLREKGRC